MKLNKKIDIEISDKPVPFDLAINKMEKHLSLMKSGKKRELLWFLEHESIFTAGTSAKDEDEKIINRSLIRYTGRGGQWTWHGKGQRVVYILLNLNDRERDIKKQCGCGGIGRRAALRSLWVNNPWKFESSQPHH